MEREFYAHGLSKCSEKVDVSADIGEKISGDTRKENGKISGNIKHWIWVKGDNYSRDKSPTSIFSPKKLVFF